MPAAGQLVDRGPEQPRDGVRCGDEAAPQQRAAAGRQQTLGQQVVAPREPLPGPLVRRGVAAADRGYGRAGLGQAERDALPRQRVDVPGRVADQEHPPRDPPAGPLPQRPSPQHLRGRRARQPLAQRREAGKQVVVVATTVDEHRHSDAVVGDRSHVGLGARRPVHLHEGCPRRHREVPPQPEAPAPAPRTLEPDQAPHGRVQAVGRDHVPRPLTVHQHAVGVLGHGAHGRAVRRAPPHGLRRRTGRRAERSGVRRVRARP